MAIKYQQEKVAAEKKIRAKLKNKASEIESAKQKIINACIAAKIEKENIEAWRHNYSSLSLVQ